MGVRSPFSFGSARSAASHAASWADTLNTAWPNTYRRCTQAAAAQKAASDTTVGSFFGTVRARACDQQCSIKWLSNRLVPNQYMVFGMACRNTLRADSLPSNRREFALSCNLFLLLRCELKIFRRRRCVRAHTVQNNSEELLENWQGHALKESVPLGTCCALAHSKRQEEALRQPYLLCVGQLRPKLGKHILLTNQNKVDVSVRQRQAYCLGHSLAWTWWGCLRPLEHAHGLDGCSKKRDRRAQR